MSEPTTDLSLLPLGERDVDLAIAGFLRTSEAFRRWMLAKVDIDVAALDPIFKDATISSISVEGEADVLACWETRAGSLTVLFENKLLAGFQPDQGARYAARAARLRRTGAVKTVLVAPRTYLSFANVQAIHFEHRIAIEDIIEAMRSAGDGPGDLVQRLAEAVRRVDGKHILGKKGRFDDLYAELEKEIGRRQSEYRISSKPTAAVYLSFPAAPRGVKLKYRARPKDQFCEIVFSKAFRGDLEKYVQSVSPRFAVVRSGSETFIRRADWTRRAQQPVEVPSILDELDDLTAWFQRLARSLSYQGIA